MGGIAASNAGEPNLAGQGARQTSAAQAMRGKKLHFLHHRKTDQQIDGPFGEPSDRTVTMAVSFQATDLYFILDNRSFQIL
jgi:hypothetical protein